MQPDGGTVTTTQKRVALIAHDAKRDDLIDLLRGFLPDLLGCKLYATHVTGVVCSQRLGLDVELLLSSVKGGDLQVGAMAAQGDLDAVIYLRDPLLAMPFDPEIEHVVRICDIHNIPVATNLATAGSVLGWIVGSHSMEPQNVDDQCSSNLPASVPA